MTNNIRLIDNNIAIALGVNEALFLNRLNFWIQQGYGQVYKGKRYVYNTFQQWANNELPLSPRQVQKVVYNLRDKGILLIEKLKAHQWRQTNYYSIDYDRLDQLVNSISPSGELHFTNWGTDPYSERTDQKEHSKRESDVNSENLNLDSDEESKVTENSNQIVEELPDPEPKPDRGKQSIRRFHNYLIKELSNLEWVRNAKAYAQKVISNLLNGSASSQRLYDQWKEQGWCSLNPQNISSEMPSKAPQNEPSGKVELPSGFKEWLITHLQLPNESRPSAMYRANKVINSDQLSDFLEEFNRINAQARSRYQDQEEVRANPNPEPAVTSEPEPEEILGTIENAKNAIKLIEKFPHHHIGQHLLEMAKSKATEEELREILKLESLIGDDPKD